MATKKKTTSKKKAGKQTTAMGAALAELTAAIGMSGAEDPAGLVRHLTAMVEGKSYGRKRKLNREVAEKALEKMQEAVHGPDVSTVFGEEIIELVQMEDVFLKDDTTVCMRLDKPLKVGELELEHIELQNLTVSDWIELESEPMELMAKGATLPDLLPIVARVIGCDEKEAGKMSAGMLNRLWGLFGCFFLGR